MMQQGSVWKDLSCKGEHKDDALVMVRHARHVSCDTLERCVLAQTSGQIRRGATAVTETRSGISKPTQPVCLCAVVFRHARCTEHGGCQLQQ